MTTTAIAAFNPVQPESLFSGDSDESQNPGGFLTLLRVPAVLLMCFAILIVCTTWSSLDPLLQPRLKEVL